MNKKKSIKQRYDEGDPFVGLLAEPLGRFDYLVNYSAPKRQPDFTPIPPMPYKPIKLNTDFASTSPSIVSIAMYSQSNQIYASGQESC